MSVRMRVADIFRIGDKTVFTGLLETEDKLVKAHPGRIEIDGIPADSLDIEGEVHVRGAPQRDLWTRSTVQLDRETVKSHDVWLISQA